MLLIVDMLLVEECALGGIGASRKNWSMYAGRFPAVDGRCTAIDIFADKNCVRIWYGNPDIQVQRARVTSDYWEEERCSSPESEV